MLIVSLAILIFLGGGSGALARYYVGLAASRLWADAFPWGTLLVNVGGCLLIGLLGVAALGGSPEHPEPWLPEWRHLLLTGFLGGFTTFSTFSLQTLQLYLKGDAALAFLNAGASLLLCLLAVWLGHYLGTQLR